MRLTRCRSIALVIALGCLVPSFVSAQPPAPDPPAPRQPAEPPPSRTPASPDERRSTDPFEDLRRSPDWELRPYRRVPSEVRIGQPYRLGPDGEAGDVFVLAGGATLEGRTRDAVVVFGDVELGSQAVVTGSLTVIGGNLTIREGAQIDRDLVVVAGTLTAPSTFTARGDHFVLDPNAFGGWMRAALDWVTRGLVWGRLVVPSMPWMWLAVGLVFVLSLVLTLLLEKPIAAAATTLGERPLTSSLVGLLVLLLAGPVCVLLAVSVIGIAVVPFVLCALLLALIVGKLAVTRRIGRGIVAEGDSTARAEAVRSFAVGFVVILIAYMVPLLGIVTWTLASVFGIGASTLAFMAAYRRENPVLPVVPRPVVVAAAGAPMNITMPAFVEASRPAAEPFGGPVAGGETAAAADAGAAAAAMPAVYPGSLLAFPKASFRDRLAAGVLDAILVVFVTAVLDDLLRDNAIVFLTLVYFIGFWAWKGTTVGGIILQLRVVRTDGAPLGFAEALVRGLSSVFSAIVLGLGFLWILKDPERQAWQDKIAGTYVVKVPRNWPI